MKKIIVSLFVFTFTVFVFASEVSDLLQEVQTAYDSGDLTTAIQKIDSAKKIIEREQLSSGGEDYIEVNNWDVVKLKLSEYLGKKVKIQAKFISIPSPGKVYLIPVSTANTYEDSVIDKLLTLKSNTAYTFYGTVRDGGILGPYLHIEAIE